MQHPNAESVAGPTVDLRRWLFVPQPRDLFFRRIDRRPIASDCHGTNQGHLLPSWHVCLACLPTLREQATLRAALRRMQHGISTFSRAGLGAKKRDGRHRSVESEGAPREAVQR